jgi:hypothetical protein
MMAGNARGGVDYLVSVAETFRTDFTGTRIDEK